MYKRSVKIEKKIAQFRLNLTVSKKRLLRAKERNLLKRTFDEHAGLNSTLSAGWYGFCFSYLDHRLLQSFQEEHIENF